MWESAVEDTDVFISFSKDFHFLILLSEDYVSVYLTTLVS